MDLFEELLGGRHGHSHKHGHHSRQPSHCIDQDPNRYRDGHGEYEEHRHHGEEIAAYNLPIRRLLSNRTAIVLLALAAIVALVILVAVLAYLLPLAMKLLGFVGENGLKSVVDQVLQLLNKIWLGSGK